MFMPGSTGVVHEAGKPLRPSISTRQRRQEPKGSSESVAQSLGIATSASAAARITEVPAGTVTARPSTSRVTSVALSRAGVPRSLSLIDNTASLPFQKNRRAPALPNTSAFHGWKTEVLREIFERAQHRQGRKAAERAERARGHGVAKVAQQFDVGRALTIGDDAIDDLDAAGRADAAGGALAARLERTELHRITGHPGEVGGIVEDHDAAVAEQSTGAGDGLVVDSQVEHRIGK